MSDSALLNEIHVHDKQEWDRKELDQRNRSKGTSIQYNTKVKRFLNFVCYYRSRYNGNYVDFSEKDSRPDSKTMYRVAREYLET